MSSVPNDGPSKEATPSKVVAETGAPTRGHVSKPVSAAAARAKKPADRTAAERAAVRSAAAKKAAATRAANAAKAAEAAQAADTTSPVDDAPAATTPHAHANPHRASARKSTASKPPASKSSVSKNSSSTSPTGGTGTTGKSPVRVSAPARSSKEQSATASPPSRATRPSSAAELVASSSVTASRELADEHGTDEFNDDVNVETIERAPRRPASAPAAKLDEPAERPARVSMTTSSVVATPSKKQTAASVYESLAAPMASSTLERPRTESAPETGGADVHEIDDAPALPARAEINEATTPRPAVTRELGGAVLEIAGLVKRYGDNTAVADIDLTVNAGSFYGIVGPNGAGKTTTLSMATGLLRPDEGSVTVLGLEVWTNPREAKRAIGVLPDRLRLFDRLTGAQLLYYSGMLRGLDNETVRARTADLASAFGLEDALDRLVSDYSAGMTKKVALAAAMIHAPRLLVLDEPFESVDPVSAATVTEILQKFVAAGGTVVMSSHSMDLIERVCDGVAIIIQGRVLASGTIDEVRGSGTLEERFVELAGGPDAAEGLEWLHSFSD